MVVGCLPEEDEIILCVSNEKRRVGIVAHGTVPRFAGLSLCSDVCDTRAVILTWQLRVLCNTCLTAN